MTDVAITAIAGSVSLRAQLGRNRRHTRDCAVIAHVANRASSLHVNLPIYPDHLSADRAGRDALYPHNRLLRGPRLRSTRLELRRARACGAALMRDPAQP